VRVADGDDELADLEVAGVAQLGAHEVLGVGAQDGDVGQRVGAHDGEAHLAPVHERGAAAARSLHDVRGGDEEAVRGDDDGAAAAHRRAPAAQAARDAQVGDARARSRATAVTTRE
jgi:hypothetical protein